MTVGLLPEGPRLLRAGVVIDGKRFEEWLDYSINVNVFNPADTFTMRCGLVSKELKALMLPGHRIEIYFGDGTQESERIVLTGWTEGFADDVAKGTETTNITGRDLASDLIENSVPEDLVVAGQSFYDVAQSICDRFAIDVIISNEANRLAIQDIKKYRKEMKTYNQSIETYNEKLANVMRPWGPTNNYYMTDEVGHRLMAQAGYTQAMRPPVVLGIFRRLDEAEPQDAESCWDFLVRYAERLEIHMWMTQMGMLVLQRPRYDQAPSYLFMNFQSQDKAKNNNAIHRSFGLNIAGMPTLTKRTGKRVMIGEKRVRIESEHTSTKLIPTSEDAIIPQGTLRVGESFERNKWSIDTEAKDLDELQRRNYYDLKAHETGFLSLRLTVRGHDQGGRMYTPDTVARVVDERLDIDDLFYVSACNYMLDPKSENMTGPTTELTLTPLDAWSPMA